MVFKMKEINIYLVVISIFVLFSTEPLHAGTIYIDPAMGTVCTGLYNPDTKLCQGGSETAFSSLNNALSAAKAGDVLMLREGVYGQLSPTVSGQPGLPITIKNYPGEVPTIANLSGSVGLWIINKSDLVIDGLKVENVMGFGRLEESERITIQNITFSNASASGTTGALKLVRSSFNKIHKNTFEDGSDILILQDNSDRNLVTDNSFYKASHSLISIRCANYNVFRGNTFLNPDQKAVEIYDCEGVSDAPVRYDATKRNIFEKNLFNGTAASSKDYSYNAMQHGAQQTIVRNNVFQDCLGGGVNYQYYSDESLYVYQNRMYNNTFYNNLCYGIIGASGGGSRFYDNRVKNNLLYKNHGCDGSGAQVKIANTSQVILENNVLATSDPGFVNADNNDFHLNSTAIGVDAGLFIASTTVSGNGTSIKVNDAGYFYDGYGISGESGDTIQIEGQTSRSTIVDINYATNTLTVDQPLTWQAGNGVHLAYSGSKPDVGAFEYDDETDAQPPMPPSNVHVVP